MEIRGFFPDGGYIVIETSDLMGSVGAPFALNRTRLIEEMAVNVALYNPLWRHYDEPHPVCILL